MTYYSEKAYVTAKLQKKIRIFKNIKMHIEIELLINNRSF